MGKTGARDQAAQAAALSTARGAGIPRSDLRHFSGIFVDFPVYFIKFVGLSIAIAEV
jgi:hypothetical protein